MYTGFSISMIF